MSKPSPTSPLIRCHDSAASPAAARHRNAPALVLVAVFVRGADREGRQLVEEEVEAVIVGEHHRDVRLLAREPVVHVVEAGKERLPVGIVLLAVRDRLADRGNVRRADAADDARHDYLPAASSLCLERLDRHAGLLRADVLHVEAENAGELGEVIDVAAGLDQLEHVAALHRRALLGRQAVFGAVGVLVAEERRAVLRAVEREAHAVERVALLRLIAVEQRRARNLVAAVLLAVALAWADYYSRSGPKPAVDARPQAQRPRGRYARRAARAAFVAVVGDATSPISVSRRVVLGRAARRPALLYWR